MRRGPFANVIFQKEEDDEGLGRRRRRRRRLSRQFVAPREEERGLVGRARGRNRHWPRARRSSACQLGQPNGARRRGSRWREGANVLRSGESGGGGGGIGGPRRRCRRRSKRPRSRRSVSHPPPPPSVSQSVSHGARETDEEAIEVTNLALSGSTCRYAAAVAAASASAAHPHVTRTLAYRTRSLPPTYACMGRPPPPPPPALTTTTTTTSWFGRRQQPPPPSPPGQETEKWLSCMR